MRIARNAYLVLTMDINSNKTEFFGPYFDIEDAESQAKVQDENKKVFVFIQEIEVLA